MTMKRIILALALLCASSVWAACSGSGLTWSCTAGSSAANVNSAIASATSGATITFAAGTYNWGGALAQTTSKIINFVGAGAGSSIINEGGFAFGGDGEPCPGPGGRVTGFTINRTTSCQAGNYSFRLYCAQGWRIDHNTIVYSTADDMLLAWGYEGNGANTTDGEVTGLFDHNNNTYGRLLYYGEVAGRGTGNDRWAEPLNLGTDHFIFYEDNTINWPDAAACGYLNSMDGNWGCRYVVRFNTIINGRAEYHSLQGDNERGCRAFELYGNNWTNTGSGSYRQWFIRSGTGVVFDETSDNNDQAHNIQFNNDRSFETSIACQVPNNKMCGQAHAPLGTCPGTNPTTGWTPTAAGTSYIDGNTAGQYGYPCRDQIGASTDASRWDNAFSNPAPAQGLHPVYVWNNKQAGSEIPVSISCDDSGIDCSYQTTYHIVENRDYYTFSSATGSPQTVGVRRGTLANRPVDCTAGVAYWVTDQGDWRTDNGATKDGRLDVCTSTNTWTAGYYMPYTYPHPLQGGGGGSPPSAPTNLRRTAQIN